MMLLFIVNEKNRRDVACYCCDVSEHFSAADFFPAGATDGAKICLISHTHHVFTAYKLFTRPPPPK